MRPNTLTPLPNRPPRRGRSHKILKKNFMGNSQPKVESYTKHFPKILTFAFMIAVICYIAPPRSLYLEGQKIIYDFKNYFTLKKIDVSGNQRFSTKQIIEKCHLPLGMNVFEIPLIKIRKLLEEESAIKKAEVRLLLPNTLHVHLLERLPKAVWWHEDKLSLIDEEGVVLGEAREPEGRYIIVIGQEANNRFIDILNTLAETSLCAEVHSLQLISKRRWNVLLKNGVIVKLPEENVAAAVQFLSTKLKDLLEHSDVSLIDLRLAPDKTFLKFKGAEQKH